ncbi:hypothetical protein BBG47_26685 [Paenibacillus sp. KS1]|uniref:hypothetical protein n=1 Tax=Paenibacillus sp. KS1 TaxID=1849249 RepID=UPI0008065113|nr:hypothetical protein [Paenibacillus sp. KS1]OBY76513.1 hypothetical protein BBG47_26685 [Paenibacillus sp. KS1]
MIINSKAVSLIEAATMLGMTEEEVLRLSQYGLLEQSKSEDGKTRVSLHSIERYAHRNGIALQEAPKPSVGRSGSLTIQDSLTKLGLHNEKEIHLLIQTGKLKAYFKGGAYVVDAQSLHDYVTGVTSLA